MAETTQATTAPVTTTATTETTAAPDAPEYTKIKHKVKINGIEQDVDYADLVNRYQQEKAADEKFKSAAQIRDENAKKQREFEEYEKDPWKFWQKRGIDPDEAAEQRLLKKIRDEREQNLQGKSWDQLSDEEKAFSLDIERRKRLDSEKRIEEMTAEQKKCLVKEAEAKAASEIDEEISAAIKEYGFKPTPAVIAQIAANMLAHLEGGTGVSAKDVVKRTHESVRSASKEYITSMTADELQAFLPKESLDGLRKAMTKSALAQDPLRSRKDDSQTAPQSKPRASHGPTSTDDAFAQLDKRFQRR